MKLTEQYIQHAQSMVNDNHTHEDMPKVREKYAHSPIDVLSLKRQNWLTGTIMNTFLDTLDLNTGNGSQKNNMNVLHTGFYSLLTTTLPGYASTPQYNTYNLGAVRMFTDHLSRSEFQKTFIIPIYIPGHWLMCIIDPQIKTYFTIDSMRHNNEEIAENIRKWYTSEMQRLHYDVSQNSDYDIYLWQLTNHLNVPQHVPKQTDGSSCGIFGLMTAFYWYNYERLPNKNDDWNCEDVDSIQTNLGHFVTYIIINTIYNENRRQMILF